jgi:hypothetical protein
MLSTPSNFRSTALIADSNASSRFNSFAPSSVEHSEYATFAAAWLWRLAADRCRSVSLRA